MSYLYLLAARLRGWLLGRTRPRRIVVILGADGGSTASALGRAAALKAWFVILSVGYPQSAAQDDAVQRAFESGLAAQIPIEATMVASRRSARDSLRWGDALLAVESPEGAVHV